MNQRSAAWKAVAAATPKKNLPVNAASLKIWRRNLQVKRPQPDTDSLEIYQIPSGMTGSGNFGTGLPVSSN
jgi:hypothetical protein